MTYEYALIGPSHVQKLDLFPELKPKDMYSKGYSAKPIYSDEILKEIEYCKSAKRTYVVSFRYFAFNVFYKYFLEDIISGNYRRMNEYDSHNAIDNGHIDLKLLQTPIVNKIMFNYVTDWAEIISNKYNVTFIWWDEFFSDNLKKKYEIGYGDFMAMKAFESLDLSDFRGNLRDYVIDGDWHPSELGYKQLIRKIQKDFTKYQ